MEKMTLFQLTSEMVAIEDALWENGGELTPELETALNENTQSLAAKTDAVGATIRKFDYTVDNIDAEIKRLQALKKVAANAAENLRGYAKHSMLTNGISKLEGVTTKISLRRSERIVTNDEEILAPYYFTIEAIRSTLPPHVQLGDLKVSKTAIKDMYKKDGVLIPGAQIEENWSVIMK